MAETGFDRSAAVDALRDLNFAAQAFREAVAEHYGFGIRETQAAAHLVTHGELSAGDLARLLNLTPSTVTHLLGRLDRAGLGATVIDPTDQRRSIVRPTDRAREMVIEIRTRLNSCFDGFETSAVPLEVVLEVLDVLRAGLDAMRGDLRRSSTTATSSRAPRANPG